MTWGFNFLRVTDLFNTNILIDLLARGFQYVNKLVRVENIMNLCVYKHTQLHIYGQDFRKIQYMIYRSWTKNC